MGVPVPPRLLILHSARRTRGCTQSPLFSPLAHLLLFFLSSSSLRFQSNLESSPFLSPWLRRKRGKGKSPCLRPARHRRRLLLSIGRSYSTEKAWTRRKEKKCGRTTVWPASHFSIDRIVTEVRYFADALWAGLVPPFSNFFNAVFSHYQIHMMHLGPESITLLAVFTFVCEAMMGSPPSVALLRHFFSLRLIDPTQCSGCVSFIAAPETAASEIDFSLPSSVPRSRERWLYVDVGVPSPCFRSQCCPLSPIQAGARRRS